MSPFTILGFFLIAFLIYWYWRSKRPVYKVPAKFPAEWRELLQTHVHFYQNLEAKGRKKYENKVRNFLRQIRITGIKTDVTDLDRLLAASSAVIPLFSFPRWNYTYLKEVLLYPAHFDKNFDMDNPEQVITGMMGSGRNMEGMMILSKKSLHQGFKNPSDKHNVGIHEFTHILDKQDGVVDGVPGQLNDKQYAEPWLKLMHREMQKIRKGKSDIDAYAGTSEEEFLAVASEYFFERPKLFKKKHPQLYKTLKKVYHQDMVKVLTKPFKKRQKIGRNDPCPCGSGEKFKNCCMD